MTWAPQSVLHVNVSAGPQSTSKVATDFFPFSILQGHEGVSHQPLLCLVDTCIVVCCCRECIFVTGSPCCHCHPWQPEKEIDGGCSGEGSDKELSQAWTTYSKLQISFSLCLSFSNSYYSLLFLLRSFVYSLWCTSLLWLTIIKFIYMKNYSVFDTITENWLHIHIHGNLNF